jgi:hypothetical protein
MITVNIPESVALDLYFFGHNAFKGGLNSLADFDAKVLRRICMDQIKFEVAEGNHEMATDYAEVVSEIDRNPIIKRCNPAATEVYA